MRVPECLTSLVDEGIIEQVVRPLLSGKEAELYLVLAGGGQRRVAKVYKEAHARSFRNRGDYTEGRRVRNTRDQRAMNRRSRYGRAQDEEAWRTTEFSVIHQVRAAGVRVPEPHDFVDGVLIMELITGASGDPAPRLAEAGLDEREAAAVFETLLREVVRMLCAGVVHGDLSDFNVLMTPAGPVIIDFPQAVDPVRNGNARKLLLRDVDNLTSFLARFRPGMRRLPYGEEIWALYERGELTPTTPLTGQRRGGRPTSSASARAPRRPAAAGPPRGERRGDRPPRRQDGPRSTTAGPRSTTAGPPPAAARQRPPTPNAAPNPARQTRPQTAHDVGAGSPRPPRRRRRRRARPGGAS